MAAQQPKTKPQIARAKVESILAANGIDFNKIPVVLLGIRGYYLDSMGEVGDNDRGMYDDAFVWITKDRFETFNGNTDPTRIKKGKGTGDSKGMAVLKPGLWKYKTGIHNGINPHPAFRQAAKVTVIRDGIVSDYEDTGDFGINIHKGGVNGTSSLGCQTVPVNQWDDFKALGYAHVKASKLVSFTYLLIDEEELRKGNLKVT